MKTTLTKEQLKKEDISTLYKLSDLVWNIQKESFYKGGPDNMKEIKLVDGVLEEKIKATGLTNAECWQKYCVVEGKVITGRPKLTIQNDPWLNDGRNEPWSKDFE